MLDVKDALTHKIGPLPGAAWAGIAIVGIVIVVKMRKGSTSSSTASTTDPGTSALQTAGGLLGGGGGSGGGVTGSSDTGAGGGAGTFTDPVPGAGTDPTPTFVPIPDPAATQTPPPPDLILPPPDAKSPTQVLDVSSAGSKIGQVIVPVLPISAHASDYYKAAGLKPSDPYTLTPPAAPQDATAAMAQAESHAIQQAQADASKTHQNVAV